MVENTITFPYTGRYYTLGDLTFASEELWFVLHGYGQLSQFFLPKFNSLSQRAYVVAPEALSLFYLRGVDGRVGATWMTREFREIAIQNYIEYLSTLYSRILPDGFKSKRIVLFAFSQGGATLLRWVVQASIPFDEMIIWAGNFPTDVDPIRCAQIFEHKKVYYIYGDQDSFVTPDRLNRLKKIFPHYGIYPEIIQFSGNHEIPSDVLMKFL